jgi:hypothetical protein
MLHNRLISLSLGLAGLLVTQSGAMAQGEPAAGLQDDDRINLLLIMVEAHEFGDTPAVVISFDDHDHLENVVLMTRSTASEQVVDAARPALLALMAQRKSGRTGKIVIPVALTSGERGSVSPWAKEAWRNLQRAGVGLIPGFGVHQTLSLGLSARVLLDPPRRIPRLQRGGAH